MAGGVKGGDVIGPGWSWRDHRPPKKIRAHPGLRLGGRKSPGATVEHGRVIQTSSGSSKEHKTRFKKKCGSSVEGGHEVKGKGVPPTKKRPRWDMGGPPFPTSGGGRLIGQWARLMCRSAL